MMMTMMMMITSPMYTQHGEEIIVLQKRISQIQTDLVTAQTQVQEASDKLEETNKQLATVSSHVHYYTFFITRLLQVPKKAAVWSRLSPRDFMPYAAGHQPSAAPRMSSLLTVTNRVAPPGQYVRAFDCLLQHGSRVDIFKVIHHTAVKGEMLSTEPEVLTYCIVVRA